MVILVWSAGDRPRNKPARLAPAAGAIFEVKALHILGLRRLNAFASSVRRLARNLEKKRKSMRWKKRIEDRERERRKLGERQKDFCFGLDG